MRRRNNEVRSVMIMRNEALWYGMTYGVIRAEDWCCDCKRGERDKGKDEALQVHRAFNLVIMQVIWQDVSAEVQGRG